jgi:hypothetical protein
VVRIVEEHNATARERYQVAAIRLLKHPLIEHELCWAVGNNALCEGDDIVESLCGTGEIVRGGDDRTTARRFSVKDVHDLLLRRWINAGDGFVEQIDLRIRSDRTRQEDPATLAARKRTDLSLCEVGHINTHERIRNRCVISSPRSTERPERWRATHHHHLTHRNREAPVNLFGLRHIGNTLRMYADRCPKDLHAATPRLHQARNALQQSRLPPTVWAKDGGKRPWHQRERDAADRRTIAVPGSNVA